MGGWDESLSALVYRVISITSTLKEETGLICVWYLASTLEARIRA